MGGGKQYILMIYILKPNQEKCSKKEIPGLLAAGDKAIPLKKSQGSWEHHLQAHNLQVDRVS
eukprot:c38628_g1_i1 orf=3-185(-)